MSNIKTGIPNKDLRFFKNQFRHLNFYTLPTSILFIVRKRFNFIFLISLFLTFIMYSII